MMYTESAIIEQLRDGDVRVFEWLFKQYYSSLCTYAYRLVGELETSEEIVAETFALIWARKEDLQYGVSVKAYIFRMVHNKCINHLKHLTVRKRYEQYVLTHMAEYREDAHPGQADSEGDLVREVERALAELPPKCREIFLLSRVDRKKYQEIAVLLNISPKTVETQMSIALRRLRDRLRHWVPLLLLWYWCA